MIGLGFVGLTTALGFSDKNFSVYGYDINTSLSNKISSGNVPFFEKGLPEALERNLNRNFIVVSNISDIASTADAVFLCVGTPCDETGKADLTFLKSSINSISNFVKPECLIVVKSTVPPGTTKNEIIPYVRSIGLDNRVAVNPEFLREGWCWQDFMQPDRIVCGLDVNAEDCKNVLNDIYLPFDSPIHYVTTNTAEFIKYLSNSLLATLISFSNEMAAVAESAGDVSVGDAFKILHEDKRLAGLGIAHYIYPGCGYGGYCLPKDTVALIQNAKGNGLEPKILQEVVMLNESMPRLTAEKIICKTKNKTDRIGILGLSFKPNSDDVRDSPAAKIIKELINSGYTSLYVYDPVAMDNFEKSYKFPLNYCNNKEDLCEQCSIVAIVTTWREFQGINSSYFDIEWVDCRYFLDGTYA